MTHLVCVVGMMMATPAGAQTSAPIPIIIDTDIGSYIDDAYALALALASPELDIKAITTVGGQAEDRAWIVCRFLSHGGFKPIPVAFGREPQPKSEIDWQIQYRRHPAVIFNRAQKPEKMSAVELMHHVLKKQKLTIIALGPLTNVARLLQDHPDDKAMIERIVLMGGSINVGYNGKRPETEWNIKSDIGAARTVFTSGLPLTVVPLDATLKVRLHHMQRDRVFAAHTLLTFQVQALHELWDDPLNDDPTILHDPVAVAASFDQRLLSMQEMHLEIDDQGMTKASDGKPNAKVAIGCKPAEFVSWLVDRVRSVGQESLPPPPKNLSDLVERGAFPSKVHTAEDYDTDIEKRWWMAGRLEFMRQGLATLRNCRGVLTQDFDDRQGNLKTSYRAVIFNPVPGPPMGKNTRLSFRYKLSGTDTIRVQLYSLSNAYHRYLSVNNLEQALWSDATVDMTQMRRPDGSGGPLSENERIDDIQFYVDPRAELLIDDIVLYDAAVSGEKRPFPQRILFTAWFDTGKQGKEWPGDFEIVNHETPRTWKAARSVLNPTTKQPWIRLHMRGERRLSAATELTFKYHLSGAEKMRVELVHGKGKQSLSKDVPSLVRDAWSEATLRFDLAEGKTFDRCADEIHFLLPAGATLTIDDVLLYVPGVRQ
jgi:inosine-uridine nucleoside N-ribohydrolase